MPPWYIVLDFYFNFTIVFSSAVEDTMFYWFCLVKMLVWSEKVQRYLLGQNNTNLTVWPEKKMQRYNAQPKKSACLIVRPEEMGRPARSEKVLRGESLACVCLKVIIWQVISIILTRKKQHINQCTKKACLYNISLN